MRRRDKFSIFGAIAFLGGLMNPRPLFKDFNTRGLSEADKRHVAEFDRKFADARKNGNRQLAAKLKRERRARRKAHDRARSQTK